LFVLATLLFESTPEVRVKLVEDRDCRDFVVAKTDRQAVVCQVELGKIGGRRITRLFEDREWGYNGLKVAAKER
jgi:hypothetical protein